ncbi:MAG TPA: class I SAM-dependent methyltransferase, partial [Levilinea sp.]|nr:class I SAM-dependent methyltransferase [Levilinea sp.]
ILDVGCGDGHFVTAAFDRPIDVGTDPWAGAVRQAARLGAYRLVVQGYGDRLPFPSEYFGSAMSNSALEHIPLVDNVLVEVARVLRPAAPFVFCVPNHNFLGNLSVSIFFDRIGMPLCANAYRRFFNRISRHHHCDAPEVWEERLERAGFKIERCWHYFSPKALWVLEWGHYFGLPSLVSQKLFKKWVLLPVRWNLVATTALVKPYYDEAREQPQGSYSFYVTRRS